MYLTGTKGLKTVFSWHRIKLLVDRPTQLISIWVWSTDKYKRQSRASSYSGKCRPWPDKCIHRSLGMLSLHVVMFFEAFLHHQFWNQPSSKIIHIMNIILFVSVSLSDICTEPITDAPVVTIAIWVEAEQLQCSQIVNKFCIKLPIV